MKRRQRLGRGADLTLLFTRGRRGSSAWFSFTARPNARGYSRFAFIVPKTVDKRAVVRNRLRRRMREYVRTRFGESRPPLDIAITCKKEAAAAPRAQFYAALEELLTRLSER